jgi:hypothetical protein
VIALVEGFPILTVDLRGRLRAGHSERSMSGDMALEASRVGGADPSPSERVGGCTGRSGSRSGE